MNTTNESRKTMSAWDRLRKRMRGEEFVISLVPYIVLLILFAWLGYLIPRSVSLRQIHGLVNLTMPLLLVSIGQMIVTLTGGLDLSVGGVLSVVSIVAALNMNNPSQVFTTGLIIIALSWLPGFLNGILIVYGRIQPFIATLAAWFILGGLALYIRNSPGGVIDPIMSNLSYGKVFGLPISIVFLIFAILFGVWFQRTRLGYEIQSIGSDRESAFYAGVKVKRVQIMAYMLSSVFATLGAIVLAGQSLSGDPKVGDLYILPSFAAVAIGGARLSGGWGSIVGAIVGALALSYLVSVTYALGMPGQWALVFQALLLILSVAFQYLIHLYFVRRQEV